MILGPFFCLLQDSVAKKNKGNFVTPTKKASDASDEKL
jgi:hypothetical protein